MTGSEPTLNPEDLILEALNAAPNAMDWLHGAQRRIANSEDPVQDLLILSAQARRRMGTTPLASDGLTLETAGGPLAPGDWTLGDAARVLLLLQAVHRFPDRELELELVSVCFQQGDELERAAVVRGLILQPRACDHKSVALEAGRTNSLLLYTALALDNPYPAACYTEHEFNQMVLKCLFTGLKIERITGLERRANPTLSRMCEDYLDERLAARRQVPRDIWLCLTPFASQRATHLLIDYLADTDPDHRYYAALAASHLVERSAVLVDALTKRLDTETEPRVFKILARIHANSI